VDERGVNHTVRGGGSPSQAVQILKITPMNLGTSGGKRIGGRIRASEAEDLMARMDEFLNDGKADETSGNKNTHILILLGSQPAGDS
jgi:hypothetical protein